MIVYIVAAARFKQLMRIYLAGEVKALTSDMKVFLAASNGLWDSYFSEKDFAHVYILQSFFYADEFTEKYIIPNAKEFMLDSGAFTFMQGNGSADWFEYADRYSDFIKRNNIQKFFELDIDSVVGYKNVKELRRRIERNTGRQSIPVWHKSRGYNEWLKQADEYGYIAIGGIVSKELKPEHYKFFPKMIEDAHKRGAKVHGLGFTALSYLSQIHFDSVDSTAWTTGNRFGHIYYFDGKTMRKKDVPNGHRLADSRKVALVNYTEWIKFQKYAETHL